MEEIKVGEYVRTYEGIIGIVKYQDTTNIVIITNDEEIELSSGIYKNSFDIIDLIEVGDYVNGIKVMNIYKPNDLWEPIEIEVDSKSVKYFLVDEIKSIVTKEQFENIEYKVGGIKC